MYRYRLSSTGASSDKFGPCEICGKHASEVFLQVEQQKYGEQDNEWTEYQCKSYFGHKECLLNQRRL